MFGTVTHKYLTSFQVQILVITELIQHSISKPKYVQIDVIYLSTEPRLTYS